MSMPLMRPGRKNPILRTPLPTLPPTERSRVAQGLTAAAALGRFELPACTDCGTVQYPPQECCRQCLSPRLRWQVQSGQGVLLSWTELRHSNDLFFRERLPWRLGWIKLDTGPTLMAHVHGDVPAPPAPVRVQARLDRSGQAVLIAVPPTETPHMADDPQLREMTCDPRYRKVLVTDGKSAVGQAMIDALLKAGADLVWAGFTEPWKKPLGFDRISSLDTVTPVPLDLSDERSVRELAGELGGKVDIVVNNAEVHRTHGIAGRTGTDAARAEMEINYFGLLRLAQSLGPALRARGSDGPAGACAWVNLLSIYALANFPPHGTFSASKAAARSLSQNLRADMRKGGIRVINLYPGPIDDEWNQLLPPPKLAPVALATALVRALKDGVEDVYPGDVAQEWLERWREDPKVLERELSAP